MCNQQKRYLNAHTFVADLSNRFHDDFGMYLAWNAIVGEEIQFELWQPWIQSVSGQVSQLVTDHPEDLSINARGYIDCRFELTGTLEPDMLLVLPESHPLANVSVIPKLLNSFDDYTMLGTYVWLYRDDYTEQELQHAARPIPIVTSPSNTDRIAKLMPTYLLYQDTKHSR